MDNILRYLLGGIMGFALAMDCAAEYESHGAYMNHLMSVGFIILDENGEIVQCWKE